jgi:hypothetical protein
MTTSNNSPHSGDNININNNEETTRGVSSVPEITINIRPLLEDVSELMTKHISRMLEGFVGDYTTYKQTHEAIMGLPCIKQLQDRILILEDHIRTSTSTSTSTSNQRPESSSVSDNDNVFASEERKQQTVSDYNEVLQLKKSIDQLTEYVRYLESQVSNDKSNPIDADEDENEVRLEIQETDISNNDSIQDTAHFCETAHTAHTAHTADTAHTAQTNHIIYGNKPVESDNDDVDSESCEEETSDDKEEEAAEEAEEAEEAEAEEEEAAEEPEAEEEEPEAEEEEPEAEEEAAEAEPEEEPESEEEAAEEEAAEAEPESEEEAADEIEVSEIKIKGKNYFTTNPQNGIIYACVDDDVGDEVGVFKNGVAFFNNKK